MLAECLAGPALGPCPAPAGLALLCCPYRSKAVVHLQRLSCSFQNTAACPKPEPHKILKPLPPESPCVASGQSLASRKQESWHGLCGCGVPQLVAEGLRRVAFAEMALQQSARAAWTSLAPAVGGVDLSSWYFQEARLDKGGVRVSPNNRSGSSTTRLGVEHTAPRAGNWVCQGARLHETLIIKLMMAGYCVANGSSSVGARRTQYLQTSRRTAQVDSLNAWVWQLFTRPTRLSTLRELSQKSPLLHGG